MKRTTLHNAPHLELLDDLVDERDEVVELTDIGVLEQAVHGDRNEREDGGVEADDHAVQELAHALVQHGALDRNVQHVQEDGQSFDVDVDAAVRLDRLLTGKTLAGPAVGKQKGTRVTDVLQGKVSESCKYANLYCVNWSKVTICHLKNRT